MSQVLLGMSSLGLFWNASLGHPKLWPLYVLSAIGAGFSSVDGSTRAAVIANIVERRQLASANALWQLLQQVGSVAGPALAGILVGDLGVASTYAVDAGSSLIALASVASLQPLPPLGGGTRFGWESIKEGVRFLRGRQLLQAAFVIDINAMILGMPRALFPALGLLRFHGGAKTVGLLYAAPGAGAFLGAVLTGWVSAVRRQGRAVLVAVAVWGLAIAAFGLVHWLAVGLVLLAIAGAADVISAVFRGTILQNAAPDALEGPRLVDPHRRRDGGPSPRRHRVGRRGVGRRRADGGDLGGTRLPRGRGARVAADAEPRRLRGARPRSGRGRRAVAACATVEG